MQKMSKCKVIQKNVKLFWQTNGRKNAGLRDCFWQKELSKNQFFASSAEDRINGCEVAVTLCVGESKQMLYYSLWRMSESRI